MPCFYMHYVHKRHHINRGGTGILCFLRLHILDGSV